MMWRQSPAEPRCKFFLPKTAFIIPSMQVLKVENDMYQVRFFGSQHQIAQVDKNSIKPINTDINNFQVSWDSNP